jgi:hypothetical protein
MQQPRRRISFVARRKPSKPFRPRVVRDGVPKYGVPLYGLCYVCIMVYGVLRMCTLYALSPYWTLYSSTGHWTSHTGLLHSATLCLDLCVALCSLSHLTYSPITIVMTITITC